MIILLNDNPTKLPSDSMTVSELIKWKEISSQGTAVAINDRLIPQDKWPVIQLKEMDQVIIISAAYGG